LTDLKTLFKIRLSRKAGKESRNRTRSPDIELIKFWKPKLNKVLDRDAENAKNEFVGRSLRKTWRTLREILTNMHLFSLLGHPSRSNNHAAAE
jgi:hypothetical protein